MLDLTTFDSLMSDVGDGFSLASEFAVVASEAEAAISEALIVYHQHNGGLFYNPNGELDGYGVGGQFAILSTLPQLESSDFLIQS